MSIINILLALNMLVTAQSYTVEPSTVDYATMQVEAVEIVEPRFTAEDVEAMAVMLAGECYIWDTADMRNAAITVCNRVDSPMWSQNTVTAVIQQTGYYGYDAHNTPQSVHYNVALQVLNDWSARSQGYELPWEPWLFFSAVNGKNEYRVNY